MAPLTRLFVRFGLTRDMAIWFWSKLLAAATLIADRVIDLAYWLTYLGWHPTETLIHRLTIGAVVLLWIAGSYSQSPLASRAELQSVTLPKETV